MKFFYEQMSVSGSTDIRAIAILEELAYEDHSNDDEVLEGMLRVVQVE